MNYLIKNILKNTNKQMINLNTTKYPIKIIKANFCYKLQQNNCENNKEIINTKIIELINLKYSKMWNITGIIFSCLFLFAPHPFPILGCFTYAYNMTRYIFKFDKGIVLIVEIEKINNMK